MAVVAGAAITATASLVGGLFQYGYSNRAERRAKQEARRSERLNIQFAQIENRRQDRKFDKTAKIREGEFARTHGLQKQQFAETKKQNAFSNSQTLLDNVIKTQDRNSVAQMQLRNMYRTRRG